MLATKEAKKSLHPNQRISYNPVVLVVVVVVVVRQVYSRVD